MNKLGYDFLQMCRSNRDGSATTQYQRARGLRAISEQLYQLGFKGLRAQGIKSRHVQALVKNWQEQGLSAGTVKNRLSFVRWWAGKVDRVGVVPKENSVLGAEQRVYVSNQSKAKRLDGPLQVADQRIQLSLKLQEAFGLRRAESIKFQPAYADRGDHFELKASWTKGGKPRTVPVLTSGQRDLLDQVRQVAGEGSLIPPDKSYAQHLRQYEQALQQAGLSRMHGLRHAYAQSRYQELTGWPAPAAGGPISKQLSAEQRLIDQGTRLQISRELGHEREQITAIYLGR